MSIVNTRFRRCIHDIGAGGLSASILPLARRNWGKTLAAYS